MRPLFVVLFASGVLQAHDPVSTKLTWTQEISRIVYQRCVGCHSKGGNAPMPLVTYADARPWAKAIKDEVLHRRMPPWGAVKGFGDFRDDPSLTQDEIMRIAEWVEGGAPEGDPAYLPALPVRTRRQPVPSGRRVKQIVGPIRVVAIRPLNSIASAQVIATLPDGSTDSPAMAARLQTRVESHIRLPRANRFTARNDRDSVSEVSVRICGCASSERYSITMSS